MAIKVENTAHVGLNGGIKCMVYGGPGMGKTRLIASAPNPIIIGAERGELSLRKFNLPIIRVNGMAQLREAYTYVSAGQGRQFQTIALDSASEIAEVCLSEQKAKTRDGRKAYGDTQDMIIQVFRDFRDIYGKNVVFLAKEEFSTDGASGTRFWAPSFPGNKLAQAAPYFFDEVFRLQNFRNEQGDIIRALQTSPDAQSAAKDRSGALDFWENAAPETGGGLSYLFHKILNS